MSTIPVKVNSNMYPYTEQVKDLPVFLTGIGGTEYQGHIKRTGEVYWAQLLSTIGYIDINFSGDFSVAELAAFSGVSQQYPGKLFRQTMNTSPSEYIIDRRIREAKRLLIETDKSIADIAQMCSFS